MGKKTLRLTESELIGVIKNIISEEVQIVTNHDKSFDYKKDGDKFYFKGKGKYAEKYPNWTLAKKKESIDAIRTKVFKMSPSLDLEPIEPVEPSQGSVIPLPDEPSASEGSGLGLNTIPDRATVPANLWECRGFEPSSVWCSANELPHPLMSYHIPLRATTSP